VRVRVELDGNFFRRDPRKTVKQNIRKMMEAMAPEAERLVQDQISGRAGSMPYYTGWTHRNIKGRAKSVGGKPWAATMVVSANTSGMSRGDAIRTKAAASGIERRWHPFRRVTSALRRSRAVLAANLVEGLE
jgi:hypothetical protein